MGTGWEVDVMGGGLGPCWLCSVINGHELMWSLASGSNAFTGFQ